MSGRGGYELRRRDVVAFIGSAAVGLPVFARAQQSPLPLVGVLNSAAAGPFARMIEAFRQSLADAGYVDGRNVRIDVRWADGQYERLPQIAADLVRGGVDVLAAPGGDVAALAAKSATSTIPIVFMVGADPVRSGLVKNLNREAMLRASTSLPPCLRPSVSNFYAGSFRKAD